MIAKANGEEYDPANSRASRAMHFLDQIFHANEDNISALPEAAAGRIATPP